MNPRKRIIEALRIVDWGDTLLELAKELKSEGMGKEEMYALFLSLCTDYDEDIHEKENNALTDTMDFISGWCAKEKRLFGDE